jgi:hypothetical protein
MKATLKRTAIATSTVACVTLTFSWSEQRGASLGVETAQAQTPSTSRSVARRHYRRPDPGYGIWAAAVASTTSPWLYDDYYCYGDPYAGRGYPPGYYYRSYPGGYCVSSGYATGLYAQPTLFPRYYGRWGW